MNLDTTLKVLQIVLGEAKTTNDCDVTTSYADSTTSSFTLGNNNVKSNGTTVVTVVAAPGDSATQRQVKEVRLFNNDTVSHTVTLQLFDGTSTWIIAPGKMSVPVNGAFIYTPEIGAVSSGGTYVAGDGININSNIITALASIANLVTAAGSDQASAQTITADIVIMGSVAASTGVRLALTPSAGFQQRIVNTGANAANVFPALGAQIGSLGTNVAATVVSGGGALLIASTPSSWVAT